jgi:hypothetical protein
VRPLTITSEQLSPAVFAALALQPVTEAIDPDLLPPQQATAAAANIRAWGARADVFGMTSVLLATGRRRR